QGSQGDLSFQTSPKVASSELAS
ncbi:hypothetical protein Zm00014a_015194, partial [Zea mays]